MPVLHCAGSWHSMRVSSPFGSVEQPSLSGGAWTHVAGGPACTLKLSQQQACCPPIGHAESPHRIEPLVVPPVPLDAELEALLLLASIEVLLVVPDPLLDMGPPPLPMPVD